MDAARPIVSEGHARIERLHQIYVARTGLNVRLDMGREYCWFLYVQAGHSEDELRLVLDHIRRGIQEQRRNPGALRFSNLIGDLDRFEEDLAEAAAEHRRSVCPGRAAVLRATGREQESGGRSQAAGDVVRRIESDPAAAAKALEELRRFKNSL